MVLQVCVIPGIKVILKCNNVCAGVGYTIYTIVYLFVRVRACVHACVRVCVCVCYNELTKSVTIYMQVCVLCRLY